MDFVKITNTPQPPWPFPAKAYPTIHQSPSPQPFIPENREVSMVLPRKGTLHSYAHPSKHETCHSTP